ncbi:class I adenylate-forming enzyme family protein [Variovorax sp. dw_308]|uniref:class I adenylate-forming enzyme family protein n=1 Tax=Variovorax sp. dw_308 TaxID=2721546 RepID=UPI001C4836DE|nr:AMP-binding protein [Variovorax sp. dw_308]
MNINSLFESNVRKYPSKPFLRYQGQSHTYAQVLDQSRRAAAVLQAQGAAAGDKVAVMGYNTPGVVVAMLGAWRLGCVVVPVNHKMQAPEVDYVLSHSGARICVFDGALAPVIDKLSVRVAALSTDSAAEGHASFDAAIEQAQGIDGSEPAAADAAEVLYTSGTTGKPKGCLHSHHAVCHVALTTAAALSMTRNERTLIAMPIWHSSPLNNWFMGTMYVGGTVVLMREFHPRHFLQVIQDEKVTLFFGAPVAYTMPLQVVPDFDSFDLSSVRAYIYGGGPIGADVARRLSAAYKSDCFFQVYGMTETGPGGTVLYPEEQIDKAGSIGRVATPGIDMRVVREDGSDARPGDIGEIWIKAESAMMEYLDDADATAKSMSNGWYKSGDLARLDADGYLFMADRSKDMIITGGENVYSKEVEDAVSAHPSVAGVAVVGRPHPEWGETVVAFVVPQPGAAIDVDNLRAFLTERIAKYKIPREFIMRADLPHTPTGKVQKHMLRKEMEESAAH